MIREDTRGKDEREIRWVKALAIGTDLRVTETYDCWRWDKETDDASNTIPSTVAVCRIVIVQFAKSKPLASVRTTFGHQLSCLPFTQLLTSCPTWMGNYCQCTKTRQVTKLFWRLFSYGLSSRDNDDDTLEFMVQIWVIINCLNDFLVVGSWTTGSIVLLFAKIKARLRSSTMLGNMLVSCRCCFRGQGWFKTIRSLMMMK